MPPIWIPVLGWLVSPIITLLLPKVLVCLGFDASNKRQDLEIHIIPELKKTLQAVDQERMMQRGKRMKTDVDALDKMAAMLRHALEDAEDILDDAQHKIVLRCCHRLCAALAACIALCKSSCVWIARVVRTKSARLLQWARDSSLSLFLLCRSEEPVLVNVSAAVVSDEPVQVTIDILASDGEPDPTTTSDVAYGTVPMTTGAAASDEPDPVTASAAVSDHEAVPETAGAAVSVPVTTGAAASDEPDPVTTTTSVVASGDETVPVTAGAAASDEPDPVTTNAEASDGEPDPTTTSDVAYGTVPMTTGAAASDEPDPVTASAAVSDHEAVPETAGAAVSVPVTTGAAASDEPDPVTTTTSVVASGDETVPVTAGAAASDEPDPVTTNAEASDGEPDPTTTSDVAYGTVPMTTGAAASDKPDPVTASAAVSDHEAVPETAGAAVSVPVTTGAAASDEPDPVTTTTSVVASGDETVPVTAGAAASDEPDPVTTNAEASDEPDPVTTASNSSSGWWLSLCSSLDFKNFCTSLYSWLAHVFEAACFYRDWSYQVVGIKKCQENASLFDIFLTAISRMKLKKRIQKVENTVSEVKKSQLLGVESNSAPNDIANKNRSRIRAASKREVFGREVLRDDIMARLRETPQGDAASSSTSPCYSVIGIYGVAGSGKTTFARYICDYIKEECEENLFDTIMCIHVSETFSVDDIFHEMLKDITKNRHSDISDREDLVEKFKEALRYKRFFLVLDDVWVKNKHDPQLEELLSPLDVGLKGSKILVTARTKEAAGALCGDELIEMPDLDEHQYMKMFMHYALSGKSIAVKEFEQVAREISKKLHRSPIAAVTVGGQLGANPNISFWKNVAKLDMLNDTMDALWWSYKQLNPDIRRCFEFCNIFPRRFQLEKDQLVCLWIAQGFVKTSWPTEEMEDVAEGYIEELVSCSFLQPKGTGSSADHFTIHDLLHDLLDKVAGNDCFRMENEWSQRGEYLTREVPRDVRHLFVQKYDADLITEKILVLQNLRTLIISVFASGTPAEEKVFESICMRLPKLRVLAISFDQRHPVSTRNDKFLVPESIIQLKYLRYLAFKTSTNCKVILPSALVKLLHIQLLDFRDSPISDFNIADLINLRHIFFSMYMGFPNIGRLTSLQRIPSFEVRNVEGYEIKQLRDLNKLCGSLEIYGLENVKSKEEALEANLAAKERLTELKLRFSKGCTAEVQAEVLEGLRPPVGLEQLHIFCYSSSRYPDWMVGRLNGGPEDLQTLGFYYCSQLGPGPELEAFPHLRNLTLYYFSWDALPGNLEHLTSLETLEIRGCKYIWSLPTLPQSLKEFDLSLCNMELMKGCQTEGDPNWLKIKHIPKKRFDPDINSDFFEEGCYQFSDEDSSHASEADQ